MESLSLYCFESDFFCSIWCLQNSSLLLQERVICSFLLLCVLSFYWNLFIHSLVEKLYCFQFGALHDAAVMSVVVWAFWVSDAFISKSHHRDGDSVVLEPFLQASLTPCVPFVFHSGCWSSLGSSTQDGRCQTYNMSQGTKLWSWEGKVHTVWFCKLRSYILLNNPSRKLFDQLP